MLQGASANEMIKETCDGALEKKYDSIVDGDQRDFGRCVRLRCEEDANTSSTRIMIRSSQRRPRTFGSVVAD